MRLGRNLGKNLFARQIGLMPGHACREFMHGLDRLEMDELGVPVGERRAPVLGRSHGGAPGTRTTRFSKMKNKRMGPARR